jgi:Aminotransferase class-III/Methyltransferase domain
LRSRGVDPARDICGFMFEAYIGWAAAFIPTDYVEAAAEFARAHEILLAFDEVQGGFGRTGKLFTYQRYGVEPDLIACGKGISSSMPLAAVLGQLLSLIGALLKEEPEARQKILSLAPEAYRVGTSNASVGDAWVEKMLSELPKGARLLDAGAGESQYKRFCGNLRYVSQDLARYTGQDSAIGLQQAKWDTSGVDITCDITAIPEPDASFDAILCTEVLEHLPEPVLALRELARLLKLGGTLIITAPFCSLTHFATRPFTRRHCCNDRSAITG